MDAEIAEIGGRECRLYSFGTPKAAVLWGSHDAPRNEKDAARNEAERESLVANLLKEPAADGFLLVCYGVADWFSDFSPWEGEAAGCRFGGTGPETLRWLTEACVPYVKGHFPDITEYVPAGYSLAGLFSLWASGAAPVFDGAVCCSGTMWLPGWMEYFEAQSGAGSPGRKRRVYLSLGGREERVRDPVMASIGDLTRKAEKLLKSDRSVSASTLVWNSGGHFADSGARLAKGLRWWLKTGQ